MSNGDTTLTEEAIQALLVKYMKEQSPTAVSVIKMIKTKIATERGRLKNVSVLPEAEIMKLVQREMKEIGETIDAYNKAGMKDRVAEEEAKLGVLKGLLPAQLAEAQIQAMIAEVVEELGKGNFGKVMKAVMAKAAGRADGKLVNELVKKAIS